MSKLMKERMEKWLDILEEQTKKESDPEQIRRNIETMLQLAIQILNFPVSTSE